MTKMEANIQRSYHHSSEGGGGEPNLRHSESNKKHSIRAQGLKERRAKLNNRSKSYNYSGGRSYSFFLLGTLNEEDQNDATVADVDFGFRNDDPPLMALSDKSSGSSSTSGNNDTDGDGSGGGSKNKVDSFLAAQLLIPSTSSPSTTLSSSLSATSLTSLSSYEYYPSYVANVYKNSVVQDNGRKTVSKFGDLQSSPMSVFNYPTTPSTTASTAYSTPVTSPSSVTRRSTNISIKTYSFDKSGVKSSLQSIGNPRRVAGPVDLDESVASSLEEDCDDDAARRLTGRGRKSHRPTKNGLSHSQRGAGPVDLDESVASSVFEDGDSSDGEYFDAENENAVFDTTSFSRRSNILVGHNEVQEQENNFDAVWKEHEDEFLVWKEVNPQQADETDGGFFAEVNVSILASTNFVAAVGSLRDESSKLGALSRRSRAQPYPYDVAPPKKCVVSPTSVAPSDEGQNDEASFSSLDTYGFSMAEDPAAKKEQRDLGGNGDDMPEINTVSDVNNDEKKKQTDVTSQRSVDVCSFSLGDNSATRNKWSNLGGGCNDEGSIGRMSIDSYGFSSLLGESCSPVNSKPSFPARSLKMRPSGPKIVEKIYQDLDTTSDSTHRVFEDVSKDSTSVDGHSSNASQQHEEVDEKPWVPSLDGNNEKGVLTRQHPTQKSQKRSNQTVNSSQLSTQNPSTSTARSLRYLRLSSTRQKFLPVNENTPQQGFVSIANDVHLTESVGIVGIIQTADESDAVSEITVQTKDRPVANAVRQTRNDEVRPTAVAVQSELANKLSIRAVPGKDVVTPPVAFDSSVKTPPLPDQISANIFDLRELPPPENGDENPRGYVVSSVKTPPGLYRDRDSNSFYSEIDGNTTDGEAAGSKYWDDVSSIGLVGVEALAADERRREELENLRTNKTRRSLPFSCSRVEECQEDTVAQSKIHSSSSGHMKNPDIFRPNSERRNKNATSVRNSIPDLELNPTFSTVWAEDDSNLSPPTHNVQIQTSMDDKSAAGHQREVSNKTTSGSSTSVANCRNDKTLPSRYQLTPIDRTIIAALLALITGAVVVAAVYAYAVMKE